MKKCWIDSLERRSSDTVNRLNSDRTTQWSNDPMTKWISDKVTEWRNYTWRSEEMTLDSNKKWHLAQWRNDIWLRTWSVVKPKDMAGIRHLLNTLKDISTNVKKNKFVLSALSSSNFISLFSSLTSNGGVDDIGRILYRWQLAKLIKVRFNLWSLPFIHIQT